MKIVTLLFLNFNYYSFEIRLMKEIKHGKYQVFPGQNYQANVIGFTGLQEVSVIHVYENTATVLIKETAETGVAKLCIF